MNTIHRLHIGSREHWGHTLDVSIQSSDRAFHTYIIGKTGSGKTTLLRNLILQEIEAGHGVGVLDPHGDLATELLDHIPPSRIDHVVYFNPGDFDNPNALNVLQSASHPELIASSVVAALKHVWRDSWGPRLEYLLYAAVASLAHCQNTSFLGITRMLTDPVYRSWVVNQVKDPVLQNFWIKEYNGYNARFMMEAISPILNKVGQVVMSPALRNIFGQVSSRINLRFTMDHRRIFIANLSKGLLGEDKSNLVGSLLVSQFEMAALSRASIPQEERVPFSLFVDEFQNFSTESFGHILSEARKYGLQLTLSHQFMDQLMPPVRQAVLGNVGSIIAFRVGHTDADVLEKELGGMFRASQFAELKNHEIIVKLLENGEAWEPFRAVTSPPFGKRYGCGDKIIARSRERYTTKRQQVEDKLERWMQFLEF